MTFGRKHPGAARPWREAPDPSARQRPGAPQAHGYSVRDVSRLHARRSREVAPSTAATIALSGRDKRRRPEVAGVSSH